MLATGNRLGVGNDPRYNSTRTFQTFPFPSLSAVHVGAVASCAEELDRFRENWLHPTEYMKEQVLEFPATVGGPWHKWIVGHESLEPGMVGTARYFRMIPRLSAFVKDRTMTKLYNENPAWLRNAHAKLDEAVAAAYGWPVDLSDEEILSRLLALNLERAEKSK